MYDDWIHKIVERAEQMRNGREVVLWGIIFFPSRLRMCWMKEKYLYMAMEYVNMTENIWTKKKVKHKGIFGRIIFEEKLEGSIQIITANIFRKGVKQE